MLRTTKNLSQFPLHDDMGLKMNGTTATVELEKEELSYLINFLVEDLRAWSEKGFESREEKEQFQRIVSVASKLREAMRETTILFF